MRRFNDAGSRNKATHASTAAEWRTKHKYPAVSYILLHFSFIILTLSRRNFQEGLFTQYALPDFPVNFQLIQENHGNSKIHHVTFIYVKRNRFNVLTYKYKSVHKERCEMYSVCSHLAQWVDHHQTLSDGRVLLSVTHLNADRSIFFPFTLWSDKKRNSPPAEATLS